MLLRWAVKSVMERARRLKSFMATPTRSKVLDDRNRIDKFKVMKTNNKS